jgi:hypothetical protein
MYNFCSRVSQQAVRNVRTKTRKIVEGFAKDKLRSQGERQRPDREMTSDRQAIARRLRDSREPRAVGFDLRARELTTAPPWQNTP